MQWSHLSEKCKQNKQMSDEEEDYMSDKFLVGWDYTHT